MNELIKKKYIGLAFLFTGLSFSLLTSAADTFPVYGGIVYYKLGGGRAFNAVPRYEKTTITLGYKISSTGLACGSFDSDISIANTLDNVKDGLDDAYSQMESAASAAISNLPGYILSKVDNNLYDLFMNAIAGAEIDFGLSTKSCEKIASELENGGDPFEKFVSISAGDTWKAAAGTSGIDITDVEDSAANSASNGIPHPCYGYAAGNNQPVYKVIKTIASVGYNLLIDRDKCESSSPLPSATSTALVKKFTSPDSITKWTNRVVGELIIDQSDGGMSGTIPGSGLIPVVNNRKTEVYNEMVDMYYGSTDLTIDNLRKISAPGVVITAEVLTSLRTLDTRQAGIFIDRISDEIAIADTVDSALLARRALVTGNKQVDIYASGALYESGQDAISDLDDELNLIMTENDIRKKLMGQSIPLLLQTARNFDKSSSGTIPAQNDTGNQIKDGRIKN